MAPVPDAPRGERSDVAALRPRELLLVALVAAAVRLAAALTLAADEGPVGTLASHLLGDERAYDHLAREMAAGTLDRERAFYQEPAYAWLLGQVYRLASPLPLDEAAAAVPHAAVHRAVLAGQHVLGVLTAVLTAILGARALGRRAGMLAGLLAAASGPLVFHETMLLKAALSLPVVLAVLLLWTDVLAGRGGLRRAALLGLVLGLGILLRGNLYLLAGLVGLSLLVPFGTPRRRPAAALAVAVTALLAVAPVTVHNLHRGELVLTTYQAGTNAAIGQPDVDGVAFGLVYQPLRAGRGDARFEETDAVAIAEEVAGRPLTSREVSAFWWERWRESIARRPGTAAARTALKLAHLFHGAEVPDVKEWAFFARALPWLSTPLSDMSVVGPLALVGLLVLPWRRRPALVAVRGGLAVVAVSLALFYVMGRYRLTAAPCLWILAAGTIERVVVGFGRGPRLARPLAAAAGLAAVGAVAHLVGTVPLPSDPGGPHTSWANAATIALARARSAEDAGDAEAARARAQAWARRALETAPAFPSPRATLMRAAAAETPWLRPQPERLEDAAWRLLLLLEGRRTGTDVLAALEAPLAVVQREARRLSGHPGRPGGDAWAGPLLADAARHVAQTLQRSDEVEDVLFALELVRRSLRVEPDAAAAHALAGRLLRRIGRVEEAEDSYRRALALGEDTAELHNNLGNVLRVLGRWDEAVAAYERALALRPGDPLVTANLARARRRE